MTDAHLRAALEAPSASDRLQAALDAGIHPHDDFVPALVERCAVEPDFGVREMLTWALVRHPAALTVPLLVAEVAAAGPGRAQALHSLSKIADPAGWAAITPEVLNSDDDEVARTAWRAAAILAPPASREALAASLAGQLARGDRSVQQSLSRAFVTLGDASAAALAQARADEDERVRIHAVATERLIDDPEEGFDAAMFEAERIVVLGG